MNLVIINKDEFNQDWNDLCDELAEKEEEIERLTKENKILRENAEHNDKVVDKVNWENERLKNIINELNAELKRYKSIIWLCEKVKDSDKK